MILFIVYIMKDTRLDDNRKIILTRSVLYVKSKITAYLV